MECKNGSLRNNVSLSSDLIIKTKYHKHEKIRTLFLFYRPFDFILVLTKNRDGRNLTVSVSYPDSSPLTTSLNRTVCDMIATPLEIEQQQKQQYQLDKQTRSSMSLFDRLNLSERCRKTLSQQQTGTTSSVTVEQSIETLNRRRCKLENLIGVIESGKLNLSSEMLSPRHQKSSAAGFRELSLAYFDLANIKSVIVEEPMTPPPSTTTPDDVNSSIGLSDDIEDYNYDNVDTNSNSNLTSNINDNDRLVSSSSSSSAIGIFSRPKGDL